MTDNQSILHSSSSSNNWIWNRPVQYRFMFNEIDIKAVKLELVCIRSLNVKRKNIEKLMRKAQFCSLILSKLKLRLQQTWASASNTYFVRFVFIDDLGSNSLSTSDGSNSSTFLWTSKATVGEKGMREQMPRHDRVWSKEVRIGSDPNHQVTLKPRSEMRSVGVWSACERLRPMRRDYNR